MPTATILTCFGCRRPVGDTGKADAVVHLNYQDLNRAEAAIRDWEVSSRTRPCPSCGKPAIHIEGVAAAFHLDGSENRQCTPNELAYQVIDGGALFDIPALAEWAVHCDDCNPHHAGDGSYCNGCYWFDARRCRTWEQAISWTAHLAEKGYMESTNWAQFLQSLSPVDA